jgi:hypothetical protein
MPMFFVLLFLPIAALAQVRSYEEIKAAADDACVGKYVNASCRVTLDNGASFQVGICVPLPNSSPTDVNLTCKLNIPDIVSHCKNFALSKDPGTALTIAGLLGLLLFLRRSKRAITLKL